MSKKSAPLKEEPPVKVIPVTDIMKRYRRLREANQEPRLKEAQHLRDNPDELAAEFVRSIEHFASYSNPHQDFHPVEGRPRPTLNPDLKATKDVVFRLPRPVRVEDAGLRLDRGAAPKGLKTVAADQLACNYVGRELLVQRTLSPARWEDGKKNGGGVRLDLLLADAKDRTPIVGELKLPGDMDPFFALIQVLACTAHLVTSNQRERLSHQYGDALATFAEQPRMDAFLLLVDTPGKPPGAPAAGSKMRELTDIAGELAPAVLSDPGVARWVRRIAAVGLHLDKPKDLVAADVRWAWEA